MAMPVRVRRPCHHARWVPNAAVCVVRHAALPLARRHGDARRRDIQRGVGIHEATATRRPCAATRPADAPAAADTPATWGNGGRHGAERHGAVATLRTHVRVRERLRAPNAGIGGHRAGAATHAGSIAAADDNVRRHLCRTAKRRRRIPCTWQGGDASGRGRRQRWHADGRRWRWGRPLTAAATATGWRLQPTQPGTRRQREHGTCGSVC